MPKDSGKDNPKISAKIEQKSDKTSMTTYQSEFSSETYIPPRNITFTTKLNGDPPDAKEWAFVVVYNDGIVMEHKWTDGTILSSCDSTTFELNLKEEVCQTLVTKKPLIFILRSVTGKPGKETHPLLSPNNYAGGTADLFPLLLGEPEVFVTIRLLTVSTEKFLPCSVELHAVVNGPEESISLIPMMITMISVHCLPPAKEGTFYVSAVGLNDICTPTAVNMGLSLSTATAKKNVWASASLGGVIANTDFDVFTEDKFIPNDLTPHDKPHCTAYYWNAIDRVLVDSQALSDRLLHPILVELAGVPKTGKLDVRGRYMTLIDAKVLLEPGETGVTITAPLTYFQETKVPEEIGVLLELPPMSAKGQPARDTDEVFDEHGHPAYIVLRFDLTEPLVPKAKLSHLYDIIKFIQPENPPPYDRLDVEPPRIEPMFDVRRIRNESGALLVHKELNDLSCSGLVPLTHGIKKTAANHLMMCVKAMLKNFPDEESSKLEWQETITRQHAASRRAVIASFAPHPPPPRLPPLEGAARSRIAGDKRISDEHIKLKLEAAGTNTQSLMSKVLRALESRIDADIKKYLVEALRINSRNRYLLWILGAENYHKGPQAVEASGAALRIAVKGDYSDNTSNAVGWAALHAFYHHHGNVHAAFVAAKKMRKAFSLPVRWKKMLDVWIEASGEEETYWMPSAIASDNPLLCAAAFFLCLRCYRFSDRLLLCAEEGCANLGSSNFHCKVRSDINYLRAVSLLLRGDVDKALEMILLGIRKYGPTPILLQMRSTCNVIFMEWDMESQKALREAEESGADICQAVLYKAALIGFKTDPAQALQRVARIHKVAPSAHTAYLIGRIFAKMGEEKTAERWLANAVKMEPLLADAWAMLCILAIMDHDVNKARHMMRTARQAGPISPDLEEQVKELINIFNIDQLPELLDKNICFCDYY